MAGKIIADIIEAPAGRISLNVANVTVASINASGLYTSTGNLLITQANSIATAAIEDGAVTSQKIAPSAIIGTVSQSGGVPTGAIIERGSNANGEYVKYADGTMICRSALQSVNMGSGNTLNTAGGTGEITFTYAAPFAADPTVNCTVRVGTSSVTVASDINAGLRSNSTTGVIVSLKAISGSGSTQSVSPQLTAIGRWF